MAKRAYGQFCGLARALDVVGERWALLIVRDLLVGPRRFTDLKQGLPKIPTNVLSTRLKELEHAGVVQRRLLPRPAGSVVYELTEYGAELEELVFGLGRWGARLLGEQEAGEIVTRDSLVIAMRSTFRADLAQELQVSFDLHIGTIVLGLQVAHGVLRVTEGPLPAADLVIEAGPSLRALMAGELSADEAAATGQVGLAGDQSLLAVFVELFPIGSHPGALAVA